MKLPPLWEAFVAHTYRCQICGPVTAQFAYGGKSADELRPMLCDEGRRLDADAKAASEAWEEQAVEKADA